MYLILFTAIAVVCAEPYNRIYLPPCCKKLGPTETLFRTPNFDESFEGVPAGGYTNEFQGVVVDADSPGSSRIAPGVESALGKPRESYGSTLSKVGEAAFKTSIGFNERFGPNTRIAPGFETIISGEEGTNDFKVGDAAYKLAPGLNTDDFFKISAEQDGAEKPLAENDTLSDAVYNSKVEKNQYQTNGGIKAGESGFNINGMQAEGSNSFKGDNGKGDKVAYTDDKEGFKPHGDHLPTSPTSPLDNVKFIEENLKDEVAGHFDDGSYDEKKYNEGNLEILSHNSNLHGSTHGAIDTINHSTQFSNNFGKPKSNQVNVNNHIVKSHITNQIKNVYKLYKEVKESDLSSINQDSVKVGVTSQSSTRHQSNGLVTQAANTFAQTSAQGMGCQAIKLNLSPKYGNSLSSVSTENANANEPINEDNRINYLSSNKRCLGCHYTHPSVTYEFPNRNTFFYYLPQNTHDSNIAKIPFKNTGKVQTYSMSIHSTISKSLDINTLVTQTTSINHEENHITPPTTVSSIKYQSPFTSSASIQPSEEFLGIQDIFKYQTDDATISIVPTVPLSTFTNYQSSLQTQTQFHTINFGKETKYLQTLDISKPTPTVSLFPTSIPFPATKYFSNNINKSNRYSTSSQFSGQVSSIFLVNLLNTLQSESNKNLKPFSGIYSFSNPTISAQNIAGSNKNVLKPVISNESSSSILGTSSQAPSPATPLNFLIEEENQQLKESFLTGPIVQATAFASSGTSKPQINAINGKYTASTTNPTVVQNIDNSYYYNKPSKPYEIPAISTSGFIKNLQNQETISNTQNLQSQININEQNMRNVNSFINTGSLQTSEFEKNIKHTDKANNQELVQSIKSLTGSDSQQEVIMPTKISNQTQFQSIKPVSVPSTSIQNKFGSTQYSFSQNVNGSFNIPTSSVFQSIKPQFGQPNFGTQTFKPTFSSTPQSTSAGVQVNIPAKPQVNQTQFVVQPVNENIGQNAFKSTQNTYGLTQFGSQKFKPSTLQSQQSVPEEKITTHKKSGQVSQTQTQVDQVENNLYQSQNKSSSTIQSSVQIVKPQMNFETQKYKPTFVQTPQTGTSLGVAAVKPQLISDKITQTTFDHTENKYSLTQSGAQKFKPSFQSQQSIVELNEYKKPEEISEINKESSTFTGQLVQNIPVNQAIPLQTISTLQIPNISIGTVSISQSNSQLVKPQLHIQNNFESQNSKPLFGQSTQTNAASLSSQTIETTKPQVTQTQFISQPPKVNFGQTSFGSTDSAFSQSKFGTTQNKFGLTQSGAQKFKPSSFQIQQSAGELYEYKKPEEIRLPNKETSAGPIVQVEQTESVTSLTKNVQNKPTSIFQSSSQFVKPQINFSTQTSKPILSHSSQNSTPSVNGQIIHTSKPQVTQTQFISQPPKVNIGQTSFGSTNSAFSQTLFGSTNNNFGQSTFGTTQNKFGLTQSGAQKFKPSYFQTQQSAGELYEYKKPEETRLPNKETSTGQIVQVEQTESVTSLTQSIQNKPPSIFQSSSQFVKPQINFSTQTSKPVFSQSSQTSTASVNGQTIHTSKPQVTQTQFISQPPKVNFGQTSFGSTNSAFSQSTFGTTQNKFGLTQSGAQKFKPSYFQIQQSAGELYEYKKPEETRLPNKETSAGQIVQVEQTESVISLTQSIQNKSPSISQSSSQFVKPQINFSTQTSKPVFSQSSQTSTASVNGQTIHTSKPQLTQTQFISQPPKVNFGQTSFGSTNSAFSQSTFGTTQNKFGLTQSGAQKFKPSSFQTQQSTGDLYIYKKPEEMRNPNKEISDGQIVQVEQTESAASLTQSTQNQTFSNFQSSNQFVKPQINFSTQTPKPVFSQSSQTSTAPVIGQTIQTSKPQVTQTQFISQSPKVNFGQTSFGSTNSAFSQSTLGTTQNKFGLTQSGAQKFKPSTFQTQSAGELYEYKKPEDTKITNKETTAGQIVQVEQTESVTSLTQSAQNKPSYNFQNSTQFVNPQFNFSTQASKPVFSQSTHTSIASLNSLTPKPQFTQTQIVSHEISQSQNVPASTSQTGSQFTKPQISQTSSGTQTSKSTSLQSIQTNKESINSQANIGNQFVITSTKPQISQIMSVSQPSTFEKTSFSNSQNKFGLTQSSTQKLKPSVAQTEQTIGELYEYKSPEKVHIIDKGKDEGQVSQIKVEQIESVTSLSPNIPNVPISQSQSNTQFVKPSTSSSIQIGVVSTKSQIGQTSFASQPAKAISEPTTFGDIKNTFGQTKLDSTQDKFGLAQFGALTFKPSNTQSQQTVREYEYDKPSKVFTTTKGGQTVINTATAQTHVGTQSVPTLSFSTNSQQSITTQSFKPEQVQTTIESHKVQENLTSPIVLNKEIITKAELNSQNQDVPKMVAQNQQYSGELYLYPKPSTSILTDSNSLIKNEQTSQFSQILTSNEGKKVSTGVQHPPTYQNSQFLNTENTKAYTTQSQLNIPQNNPSFVSTNSKVQLNLDKHKEENEHTTSHIHTGSQSTKPVIGHTILETKLGQTQFGLNPNLQIKSELTSAIENDTTVNNKTSQLTQNNQYINQDTKVGLTQITSQSQSLGTQTVPNTLKITSTKPVNQININSAGNPSLQKTESINSETLIGIQPAKSIPCQISLTEKNHESSLQTTEEVINQSTASNIPPVKPHDSSFLNTQIVSPLGYQKPQVDYEQIHNNHYPYFHHHHDHPHHHGYSHHNDHYYSHEFPHHHDYHHLHYKGPESFGFHNHEFGYRQNKPNGHFDYGFPGKNLFPQNSFPFGQHNFPNTFESSFNSAVATASTGAPEIKNQFYTNPTQVPTIHQTRQPFSSALTTNEFTNTHSESSITPQPTKPVFINSVPGENQISVEPTEPTILSNGTETENLSSLSNDSTQTIDAQVASANIQSSKSIVSTVTQPSVLFGKPAAHKFVSSFGSNTAATADIIPSLDSKDKSSAQVSSQPNIVQIEGAKNVSPFSSNAVAMAQSGNGFRQSSFANAIAMTGPLLSQFDIHRGSLQSYSSFDGHSSNVPIASGPQLLASPGKATFGTPSFSNAFASASKDSSFASSFVSSTPVTTVVYDRSISSLSDISTIKPGFISRVSGKGETFDGPHDPPKFDGLTGYHY